MTNNGKISNQHILLLFGFLFFAIGTLGLVQIGLLEGLYELIPASLIILLVGLSLLLILLVKYEDINVDNL